MAACEICGKGAQVGHNIQHQASGQWRYRAPKTRRVWKANVQKARVVLGGVSQRLRVCSRCLRTLAKSASA
jgi:large subunit ribosomal protein L28